MHYYFAPMEGITDRVFRQVHHKYFPGVDAYYMPFLSPTVHRALTPREERELPYAQEDGYPAVPQLLTKVAEDFIWMAQQCQDRGYSEVNLNLGCPSGTVTAKGKGSGMLRDPDALDAFLDAIFSGCSLPISIKTRLGMESPEEFPKILEIYNRYPIRELTVHPRVRKTFYTGCVDRESFRYAYDSSKNPLCYNGDLRNLADVQAIAEEFPGVQAVMLGRGLVGDPGMLSEKGTTKAVLQQFCNELLERYVETFGSTRNAMFRTKENWGMLIGRFQNPEKLWKKLRKTTSISEYKAIIDEIFATLELKPVP